MGDGKPVAVDFKVCRVAKKRKTNRSGQERGKPQGREIRKKVKRKERGSTVGQPGTGRSSK